VFTNGIGQSWIPYGGIHTLLGVLPVLLHENPERVAVIGLGSGDTLYGLLAREKTREVWCAEIVSGQRQTLHAASRDAGMDAVRKLLEDPRVRFIEGDGRMLLARASEGFDIIEADALRPTSAHAGTLYSEQYYALLKARLRPGGMAVTWLPTQRVAATLARVFPHVTVFGGVLGIGTQTPLNLDAARLGAVLQDPKVAAHFQQAGIALPALLELVMGPGKVIQTVGPDFDRSTWGETNSDFFPRDEWGLPSLWGRRGR
jgi:hypothetical protein